MSFYLWRVFTIVVTGCPKNGLYGEFWACFFVEIKRCGLLIALFCHIPANFLCLVRIRQLDAVIQIMEDIRKLQGLRGILQDFSRSLEQDKERQALLDSIDFRVLKRIEVLKHFRSFILAIKNERSAGKEAVQARMREGVKQMNSYFEFAASKKCLGPSTEWLQLD